MSKRLTPARAAERLGISVKRIYALIDAGELAAIDVSLGEERPRWRIEETALDAFESARRRRGRRSAYLAPASAR